MTDRVNGFIVVLEKSLRDDDAEATRAAIAQIRGVIAVKPNVEDISDAIAASRARTELARKLMEILFPERPL